jgi:molybdopterin-guanine dinucleotide biosynthesis protein A
MVQKQLTAIILAGGKSSRMGYDKGLAETSTGKIIDLVIAVLKQVTEEIIIIANTDSYNYLGVSVYKDLIKDSGPLGGIYTGLYYSKTQDNIIVACDMPFVSLQLLTAILDTKHNKQVVIPTVNNKLEPLCGYYKNEIKDKLKEFIETNNLSVHKVITNFNHLIIKFDDAIALTNINTPEDLLRLKL